MNYIIYAASSKQQDLTMKDYNRSNTIVTLDKGYAETMNGVIYPLHVPAYIYKSIEQYIQLNNTMYVSSDASLTDPYSGNKLGSFSYKLELCVQQGMAWFDLDFILKKFGVTPRIYKICLELSKLSGNIDTPLCVSRDTQCKALWYWLVSPEEKLSGAWRDIMYTFNKMFDLDVKLRNRYEFNMFIETVKKMYFV